MITEKMSFARSMALTFSETNSSTTIRQDINPNFCIQIKKGSSRKKLLKKFFALLLLRTQTLTLGSECSKNYHFVFVIPLFIYLSDFDLLNMSYFS